MHPRPDSIKLSSRRQHRSAWIELFQIAVDVFDVSNFPGYIGLHTIEIGGDEDDEQDSRTFQQRLSTSAGSQVVLEIQMAHSLWF